MIECAKPPLLTDLPVGIVTATVSRGTSDSESLATPPGTRARGPRLTKLGDGRLAATACLEQLGATKPIVGSGWGGEPLWPAGFIGSISHSKRLSVAAVAKQEDFMAVGIDIEDDRDVDGIEPYINTASESGVVGRGRVARSAVVVRSRCSRRRKRYTRPSTPGLVASSDSPTLSWNLSPPASERIL